MAVRRTTLLTLATCGAAFTLPLFMGGVAHADSSVTVYGSDSGVARKVAQGGSALQTQVGSVSGGLGSSAKTILVTRFGRPTTTKSSYGSPNYYLGTSDTSSATGTVLSFSKFGNTTIVTRYTDATAECSNDTIQYVGYYARYSAYNNNGAGCTLSGTGTYVAIGGAVTAGLPAKGTADLYSRQYTQTYPNSPQYNNTYNSARQSFNNNDD